MDSNENALRSAGTSIVVITAMSSVSAFVTALFLFLVLG
jgi:hypothetical protein